MMVDLRALQQQFMSYLLRHSTEVMTQVESTPMMSAEQRLSIYSSGYRLRLKEAISTDYEKLHSYLGDEQFEQLMDDYIDVHPSSVNSLRFYSITMPDWLGNHPQYSHYQQIIELALIEKAFADSFDSATISALDLSVFATIPETAWPEMIFTFQPSLQVLQLKTNAFALWKALTDENTPPAAVDIEQAESWVLWRKQDLISHYRPLQADESSALEAALNGANFAEICESLLAYYDENETPLRAVGLLQSWVQEEMLSEVDFPD